jgi:hypothetical protein
MKKWFFLLLFVALTLLAAVGIVLSVLGKEGFGKTEAAALFAGLLAFAIVWWQGHLIKKQMELQAIIELEKEWNASEMVLRRSAAWNHKNEPDKDCIESVLEFFEKVSTFERRGVISADLIWDTLGWYLWRYHYYSRAVIDELRVGWTPKEHDKTLYRNLEILYRKLLKRDIRYRNRGKIRRGTRLRTTDMEDELNRTKDSFIRSERGLKPKMEQAPRVMLELKPSPLHGVGVFAVPVPKISKGQKIAEGIHEADYLDLIPWQGFRSFHADFREKVMDFCIGTPEGFIPPENMDFNKLSIDWYLNHSCEGNCGFSDDGDFVAIRDIQPGEELAYDYGLAESNPNFKMTCSCGSKACRKVITGNDWKDEEFQAKNEEYMLPHLRKLIAVPA